jgi:hypothetical protein
VAAVGIVVLIVVAVNACNSSSYSTKPRLRYVVTHKYHASSPSHTHSYSLTAGAVHLASASARWSGLKTLLAAAAAATLRAHAVACGAGGEGREGCAALLCALGTVEVAGVGVMWRTALIDTLPRVRRSVCTGLGFATSQCSYSVTSVTISIL